MFCVVERDLASNLRELDDEFDVPDSDEERIAELMDTFHVSEREAEKAYYRNSMSFEAAAAWLEQYTAEPPDFY